jgi:hypothetical protein
VDQLGNETSIDSGNSESLHALLFEVLVLSGKIADPSRHRKNTTVDPADPIAVAEKYLSKDFQSDFDKTGCVGCFPGIVIFMLVMPIATDVYGLHHILTPAEWLLCAVTGFTVLMCWIDCSRIPKLRSILTGDATYRLWLGLVPSVIISAQRLWRNMPIILRSIILGKMPRSRTDCMKSLITHISWYVEQPKRYIPFGFFSYLGWYIWIIVILLRNWTYLLGNPYALYHLSIGGAAFWGVFAVGFTAWIKERMYEGYLIKYLYEDIQKLEQQTVGESHSALPPPI